MSSRTYAVAGNSATYISDIAQGRTIINLSNKTTVYISETWSMLPGQGYPLTAGMSTIWASNNLLYAITADGTEVNLEVTDVAGVPQTFNLPPAARIVDTWHLPVGTAPGSNGIYELTQDVPGQYTGAGGINVSATIASTYGTPGTSTYGWAGHFVAIMASSGLLIPLLYSSALTSIGGAPIPPYTATGSGTPVLDSGNGPSAIPTGGSYTVGLIIDRTGSAGGAQGLEILAGGLIIVPT